MPDDKTIYIQMNIYLKLELGRVQAGNVSPSEYDLARYCLNAFRDWVGAESPIDRLDAEKWEGWWEHLLGWEGSIDYKKKRYNHARKFVGWLASKGLIPVPPNLHSKRYRSGEATKAVPTLTVDEVRMLVSNATGQVKLHLLLMANCGMTQQDVADLGQHEVDWAAGRIVRKRSKTRENENVPTVDYKLWPETWALLKEHRSADPVLVLLTKSGSPWKYDRIGDDGKRHKVDNFRTNYETPR